MLHPVQTSCSGNGIPNIYKHAASGCMRDCSGLVCAIDDWSIVVTIISPLIF